MSDEEVDDFEKDYFFDWDGSPLSNSSEPRIIPSVGLLKELVKYIRELQDDCDGG